MKLRYKCGMCCRLRYFSKKDISSFYRSSKYAGCHNTTWTFNTRHIITQLDNTDMGIWYWISCLLTNAKFWILLYYFGNSFYAILNRILFEYILHNRPLFDIEKAARKLFRFDQFYKHFSRYVWKLYEFTITRMRLWKLRIIFLAYHTYQPIHRDYYVKIENVSFVLDYKISCKCRCSDSCPLCKNCCSHWKMFRIFRLHNFVHFVVFDAHPD